MLPHSGSFIISRLVRDGTLKRLKKRGLVYVSRAKPHPALIASRLTKDSVLSHRTALWVHGVRGAEGHRIVTYSSLQNRPPFRFQGKVYLLVSPPARIRECSSIIETQQIIFQGKSLLTHSLERAIVECIQRPDLCGGAKALINLLRSIRHIHHAALLRYLEALGSERLYARVGFALDRLALAPEQVLHEIEKHALKTLSDFSTKDKGKSSLCRRWKILYQEAIFH